MLNKVRARLAAERERQHQARIRTDRELIECGARLAIQDPIRCGFCDTWGNPKAAGVGRTSGGMTVACNNCAARHRVRVLSFAECVALTRAAEPNERSAVMVLDAYERRS